MIWVFRILAICGLLFAAPLVMSAQVEFSIRGVELSKGYTYLTHLEKPSYFTSDGMNISSPQPMLKIEVEVKNTGNDTIPIFESPGISDKFFLTCKINGKVHKNAVLASALNNGAGEKWSIAPGDSYVFNLFDWSGAPEENFHQWFFDIFDSIEVEYHRRTSVNEYRSEVTTYTARVADWDGLMIRGVPRGPHGVYNSMTE